MNRKIFSSIELVVYTFIVSLIPTIFPVLFAIFSIFLQTDSYYMWFVIIPIFYIVFWFIHFLFFRNAFCRLVIDEKGIRNKYLSVNWSDMGDLTLHLLEIELLKYAFPKPIRLNDMLVIGEMKSGGFALQNPQKSIMIALTPKNKKLIKKYASGIAEIEDLI